MGAIDIVLRSPHNVNGIAADPQPDWSFDNLLLELDSIEKKHTVTSGISATSFIKKQSTDSQCSSRRLRGTKQNCRSDRGFVMQVSDVFSDSDSEEENDSLSVVPGRRFTCDEIYLSDDSEEDEASLGIQSPLMDRMGLAEGALCELTHEFQLNFSEDIRSTISNLETEISDETEKFASRIAKVEKYQEMQYETERRFDLQHRRTIAGALDSHLTDLQRDHEHISQLEERKIRDDAARQEAKRKEKALQEEKLRLEKAKADEEIRLASERAKEEAMKAEKQALEEAEAKRAVETAKEAAQKALDDSKAIAKTKTQSSALIRASENALELEKRRRHIYDDLFSNYESIKASGNQGSNNSENYNRHEKDIGRRIKTISNTVENIRTKADDLVQLIRSSVYPQPISMLLFAEKAVSNCTNQTSNVFATSRVIVLVTAKIPEAMDILLAALNKACIYTVPKHIRYSQAAFTTAAAYYKAIGYEEENGRIENTDNFLERVSSYMKLYGALVQTEVGVQNHHGLTEGWSWLARFLNTLPANRYTATALHSFLESAGYALYRKYKNQFEKLMNIISRNFIDSVKEEGSAKVKLMLRDYVELSQFKREPEGLPLQGHLDSNEFV